MPRTRCLGVLLGLALLAHVASGAAQARPRAERTRRPAPLAHGIRGITVGPIESSQQPGRGYGTPYSEALLDELVALGANAISITPFGRIWSLDSTEILMDFEQPYEANRQAVGRMIAQAHTRGLQVLLIPHLWVETGGWRGEIDPGSPERWQAYQRSYRDFVTRWAADAERFGADALSIGVECKSWSGRLGAYWHDLITEIRKQFRGQLTYSSNWDEVEDVVFWDELDWVGVNAFYPLAEQNDASYTTYQAHAEQAVTRIADFGERLGKPVVFVEIGYTTRTDAAVEPWLWPDGMQAVQVDEWEQARALVALGSAAAREPRLLGFYVWRYYANLDDVSQEAIWGFSPHGKLAEPALGALFRSPWMIDRLPELWPGAWLVH
jgi:hypothetical protein